MILRWLVEHDIDSFDMFMLLETSSRTVVVEL